MYFYSSGSLSRDCLIVKPIFTAHVIRKVDIDSWRRLG